MINGKIWLASPTMHGDEMKYIQEAFDTNWVAPLGPNVTGFENEVAAYVGVTAAAALVSGTSALHLAVKLAGVKPGDIVFCSDMTFAATVNPVSYERGNQVFIDSERVTWNMDPAALEKAFEKYPDCKVVLAANLYGTPAKLDEIKAIADAHGAVLIEDAAESLSATYKGQQTGTFGKYAALSYNGNKLITTSGGGIFYLFQPIQTANTQAIKAVGGSDLSLKLEIVRDLIQLVVLIAVMWISVDAIVVSMRMFQRTSLKRLWRVTEPGRTLSRIVSCTWLVITKHQAPMTEDSKRPARLAFIA